MALIDKLTAIANAIRGKTGGTEKLTLDQMAAQIAGMESGGEDTLTAMITNTLTEYSNSDISTIKDSSFRACTLLESIDIPNATFLGQHSFEGCEQLAEISFPKAVIVSQYSFANCKKLETVNLPVMNGTTPHNSTEAPSYLFQGCIALKVVTLPELQKTGAYGMFRDCTALEEVRTPKTTTAGQYHMYGCKNLRIWDNGFANLTQYGVMNNTSSLETLILRSTSVASINPCAGSVLHTEYTGDTVCNVYVPSALIESYQSATNWSALYAAGRCVFVALEGSEYE